MERLPDRGTVTKAPKKESEGKKGVKDQLGMYGALMIVVAVIFLITQKVGVPFDQMKITEFTPNNDNDALFVVGELEEGQRFAGASVSFDEEKGIAEIKIARYSMPTVFGSQNFVAMIEEKVEDINEIWLIYTDEETGKETKTKLPYK